MQKLVLASCLTAISLLGACEGSQPTNPSIDLTRANNPSSLVFTPQAQPNGAGLTEWNERWWKWELSAATDVNPGLDETGEDCAVGQPDDGVWYLGSIFRSGSVTRDCDVPTGRKLLIALSTALYDYPCPDPNFQPAPGQTLEEFLAEGAASVEDRVNQLTLVVDGVAVPDLFAYRTVTPLFEFTGHPTLAQSIDGCITGSPQPAVADGFFVMVKPLPPGEHTISFGAATSTFSSSITYNITVVPG